MATSESSKYNQAIEKLNALIDFSSGYSSSNEKVIYDTVLIDDPFKKKGLQRLVPGKHRDRVIKLVESFEISLETLSNSQYISKEAILQNYKSIIREAIETALDKDECKHTNRLNPELYGYSVEADATKRSATGILNDEHIATARIQKKVLKHDPLLENRKRASISKEAKIFMETVFKSKRTPNSQERKIIAEKCGLTPVQVRVWFTNKRMRSKE